MGVQNNTSDTQVVAVPKFYQGIGNFKVLAVNPTKEQFEKVAGIELNNEPEYVNINLGDRTMNKVVFLVKNFDLDILTRVEFLISDEHRVSQNGKTQFINAQGSTAWDEDLESLKNNPKMSWFDSSTARPAYEGEELLINFIKAWANVKPGDEASLDTIDKVVLGDVKELRNLQQALKGNEVRLLLGVDDKGDKQYQKVYNKFFGRPYAKDSGFLRKLNEDYGEFKAIYDVNDFTLKEYDPSVGPAQNSTMSETDMDEQEDALFED